jgi:hypothetical protein
MISIGSVGLATVAIVFGHAKPKDINPPTPPLGAIPVRNYRKLSQCFVFIMLFAVFRVSPSIADYRDYRSEKVSEINDARLCGT